MRSESQWLLTRASLRDLDDVHRLMSKEPVYRYLNDGQPPARQDVEEWIRQSSQHFEEHGIGLWLLHSPGSLEPCLGAVRLVPDDGRAARAELVYALDPSLWGKGIAACMASAALRIGFSKGLEHIWSGVDAPNERSAALAIRLGMRKTRAVVYPLGPGVEFEIDRGDPVPEVGTIPLG